MSQKLRGIPPGGILLFTILDSFQHFLGSMYVYSQILGNYYSEVVLNLLPGRKNGGK